MFQLAWNYRLRLQRVRTKERSGKIWNECVKIDMKRLGVVKVGIDIGGGV